MASRRVFTDAYRPDSGSELALVASYEHDGPVLRRRAAQACTYLSLVATEGFRHSALMVVRFAPAHRR